MSENKTLRIRLTQCTLHHIVYVYHDAGHLHEAGRLDLSQLEMLEAFGQELVRALNQQSNCTPSSLLAVLFSANTPGLTLELDEQTTLRFIFTCKELISEEPVGTGGPYSALLHIAQGWLQENISNWLPDNTLDD